MSGTLYDVSAAGLTIAECDQIALEHGGVVSQWGTAGFACPKPGPVNAEYSSFVTATRGIGNNGYIILRGLTPRARRLIHQGKVVQLFLQGITSAVAEVAARSQYGMEFAVAELAEDLLPLVQRVGPYTGPFSHREFDQWAGFGDRDNVLLFPRLSMARKRAAAKIAAAVVKNKGGK